MRRRAVFYLFLGFTTALLMVALATGFQTGGSTDPNAWMWAQRHVPLLQILDLASFFVFVVIGLFGLTVGRLQVELQHQAEDFGDQMQTLLHRNDELAKVNEEYAEQIAALESQQEEPPALAMGDSNQRVISALHWQVDAQARQLEAVHRTLEHQQDTLQELQQHVHALAATSQPPALSEHAASPQAVDTSSQTSHASPLPSMPEKTVVEAKATETAAAEEDTKDRSDNPGAIADWTANDGSTVIGEILEFDVSAFASPEPSPPPSPPPITLAEIRTYPVDNSFLAVAAGHLSSMPESNPAPTPAPEPTRVEISVGKGAASSKPPEISVESPDLPPPRTEGALALDMAESALSSLHSETQEALSSLRAHVEATISLEPTLAAPVAEPEKANPAGRRKPWRMRF